MRLRREILLGYSWSFYSPIFLTLVIAVAIGLIDGFTQSFSNGVDTFLGTLFFLGTLSVIFSGIVSGVILIPVYCLSKSYKYSSSVILCLSGGIAGLYFGIKTGLESYYSFVFIAYGTGSGFFFWLGSNK